MSETVSPTAGIETDTVAALNAAIAAAYQAGWQDARDDLGLDPDGSSKLKWDEDGKTATLVE